MALADGLLNSFFFYPAILAAGALLPRLACYLARGPDADRRGKAFIYLALEGSHFRAYSQATHGSPFRR
jgi:hypothetical protein